MTAYKKFIIKEIDPTPPKLSSFEVASIVVNRIKDTTNGIPINVEFEETLVPADKYREDNPLVKLDDLKDNMIKRNGKWVIPEDNTYKLILKELNNNKCPLLMVRILRETDDIIEAVIVNPNLMIKPLL